MRTVIEEKRYSEKEAAKIIGTSQMTVRRRRENGELGYYKIGNSIRIGEKHIAAYLAACERGNEKSGESVAKNDD